MRTLFEDVTMCVKCIQGNSPMLVKPIITNYHVIPGEQRGMFTFGHENVGWIEAMGDSVTDYQKGDAVEVYGFLGLWPW